MEEKHIHSNAAETGALTIREDQDDEIDLIELFYLFWEHILQIIVCIIVGGVLAFAGTYYLMVPQYSATAKMYIVSASNNSIINLNDLALSIELAADYQELLLSRPLMEDLIDEFGLDMMPEEMSASISIGNPQETRILSITVTNPDPQLAADLANRMAELASVYLPRIMECPAPNIYEDAIPPLAKSSPSYVRNTLLGAAFIAALYCGFLAVRYILNDSFSTPEEISRYFGVQPLAVIPEGKLGRQKQGPYRNHGGGHQNKPAALEMPHRSEGV